MSHESPVGHYPLSQAVTAWLTCHRELDEPTQVVGIPPTRCLSQINFSLMKQAGAQVSIGQQA
jgi:hypothetical protein